MNPSIGTCACHAWWALGSYPQWFQGMDGAHGRRVPDSSRRRTCPTIPLLSHPGVDALRRLAHRAIEDET